MIPFGTSANYSTLMSMTPVVAANTLTDARHWLVKGISVTVMADGFYGKSPDFYDLCGM
jgi:subtilisin family serine protease